MFCPNCGTQNPDAAQTCSKCNFHLKSVAAPKFKGTMLMMNQAAAASSTPPPGAAAARPGVGPQPPGAWAPAIPNKLKGTMVGVAPMAGLTPTPPPAAVPAPGPAAVVGSPRGTFSGAEGASAFSPPVPQPGVNPLGGTVAADQRGFPGGFGAQLPAGSPYSAPLPHQHMPGTQLIPGSGGASPFGQYGPPPPGDASPQAHGGNPYAFPVAPNPYGGPGAYVPQPGGVGAPGGGSGTMMPYSQPTPSSLAALGLGTGWGAGPTRRNALLTFVLPVAVMFAGAILNGVLSLLSPALGILGALVTLAGAVWSLVLVIVMANELKSVTRSETFAWWPVFVPIYNWYWALILVPREVAIAKQQRGVQKPPRSIVLYLFLWHYALASDLNDLCA
ncbi:MAG: zinc-ribbon domain-containing protein [Polyangiaceae bacterium]